MQICVKCLSNLDLSLVLYICPAFSSIQRFPVFICRSNMSPLNLNVLRKAALALCENADFGRRISIQKKRFAAALNPQRLLDILSPNRSRKASTMAQTWERSTDPCTLGSVRGRRIIPNPSFFISLLLILSCQPAKRMVLRI